MQPKNKQARRRSFTASAVKHPHRVRRQLVHEPLEMRLVLDGSGLVGNPCAPDLDLANVDTQSIRPGEELVLDLLAAGGTVTDLDAAGNPTGDTIRLQLDPDDNPDGATITSDGLFRWTPTIDQTGPFEIVVLAVDAGDPPLADAEVFLVEVVANMAPDLAAISDAIIGVDDVFEVTVTASDVDGDNLTFMLDRDDPNSTLPDDAVLQQLDNNTAVIRWTPDTADAGEAFEFSVIVTDDGFPPQSDREVFTVNVSSVAATDDVYDVAVGGVLMIDANAGVLANDTNSDPGDLTATLLTGPTNGDLDFANDGSFTYTPTEGFQGTDTFTYQAENASGITADAVVTILVNSAPVTIPDAYELDEDTSLVVDAATGVLSNDSDLDGDPLTLTLVNDTSHGELTLNGDGSFTYVPDTNFNGEDGFTYIVSDGIVESEEVSVTISVTAVNAIPQAVADTYVVNEGATLNVPVETGVLANDSDQDEDVLTATLVDNPDHGTLTLNDDGSFSYMPDADFRDVDTFTYVATDGSDDSQITTVSITVNDEPVAVIDNYSVAADSTLTVDAAAGVLANDSDADGDDLTAALVEQATRGTLTLNDDGSFTYVPEAGFSGIDTFRYTATDGTTATDATLVTIFVDDETTFSIPENSPAGTVVGQLVAAGNLGPDVVFSLADPNLDAQLELAADDHLTGNPAGTVVLIEYVDYQCPVCRTFHPIVQQLVQDFPDDLVVITRHFPLQSSHVRAFAAAVATEAAHRQGAFEAYGDLLFEKQLEWQVDDPQPFFEEYATDLGLDLTQFRTDQADTDLADRVQRDLDAVGDLGGTGTPTFFLNGDRIVNPASAEAFADVIQAEVDATDAVFAVDRLTGQIIVHDSAALDFETNPSFMLTVNAIGLDARETIVATINLVNQPDDEAARSANLTLLDDVFAEEEELLADPFAG